MYKYRLKYYLQFYKFIFADFECVEKVHYERLIEFHFDHKRLGASPRNCKSGEQNSLAHNDDICLEDIRPNSVQFSVGKLCCVNLSCGKHTENQQLIFFFLFTNSNYCQRGKKLEISGCGNIVLCHSLKKMEVCWF